MKKTNWRQGKFIDQRQYNGWTKEEKDEANYKESFYVRPSATGNAICKATYPEDAIWIASRLNLADKLEAEEKLRNIE